VIAVWLLSFITIYNEGPTMSNKKVLNEFIATTTPYQRYLARFSKMLLKQLYGDDVILTADVTNLKEDEDGGKLNFSIAGDEDDVKSYARAIMAQKNYLDAYVQFGVDHFQSQKTREILDQEIAEFERTTGLLWPFSTEE
tara:strand:- start:5683 stop:6102 length:420 start_codon:yes stop_codon:yes gene_type:complete